MSTNSDLIYSCNKIYFEYVLGTLKIKALEDVNLNINKGDFICLSGPSGSGKSTLLNLLGLIEPVQSGSILFKGSDLSTLDEKEKNHIRRFHLGFVFQNFHLINILNAYENVEYFLCRQGVAASERKKIICDILEAVGLKDQINKRPLEMSGGQRQRVAIARALAKRPQVIIADEPTASLDQQTGYDIMTLLKNLSLNDKTTVILASHDPMVVSVANRVIRLKDGKIYDPS
ncbi:MAG: ABC transporter ATP-binding protein [Oligoflexia bacterium]|nr:ABC transporter ATP-binding protein [Oligoflexia bacterium]